VAENHSLRVNRAIASILRSYTPVTPKKVRFIKFFSLARAKFFGLVFSLFTDGVTLKLATGRIQPLSQKIELESGPLVIVANHTSHADAAALVAAIGRVRPVLVAAAADYWLAEPVSEAISRALIGIWPIRRNLEKGRSDLLAAADLVRHGVALIVFSEGTRSQTGQVAEFHLGAFRLAQATGAKILPVAISGTNRVLPRSAKSITRAAVSLQILSSIATPTDPAISAKEAKVAIETALESEVVSKPGRAWARAHRLAFSWVGLALLFAWSFAEGIFWPFIAEMPLILLIGTVGKSFRGLALILSSVVGSMAGITVTWWLSSHGIPVFTPLTTPRMFQVAQQQLLEGSSSAFYHQMWNGIPVKVYASELGALGFSGQQLLAALIPRIIRISLIGAGAWAFCAFAARWLKPCLGVLQAISLTLFVLGLALAVGYWS
jgi:1-acyl-sn-glycerol-3-phosphate acyltransferase